MILSLRFNPNNIETNFLPPATTSSPIQGRKYTLTHSDDSGMMFLDIGNEYNYSAINKKLRDEVLGVWKAYDYNSYRVIFYVYVGDYDYFTASKRYTTFKRHLKSALQSIFYGDREFLMNYSYLVSSPIYVKFDSNISMFNNYESYGIVQDYLLWF